MNACGKQSPNLLLINANVITLDPIKSKAGWVAISGGKITGLGSRDKAPGNITAEIIDCGGKTIIPGFVDSHMHLLSLAESLISLDLKPGSAVRSITDIQNKIHNLSQTLPQGTWIKGKGYNEFYLSEKRHPNRHDLDKAAPAHPVKLTHRSGHAHVLNTLAMQIAGINGETPDPPCGIIERDLDTGMPTGLLYEMSDFLSAKFLRPDNEEIERSIKFANIELISNGITTIQDASPGNDLNKSTLLRSLKERGLIDPGLNIMLGMEEFKNKIAQSQSISAFSDDRIKIKTVKIVLDETTGQLLPAQDELDELIFQIHESGMQAAVHAIEENAIISACTAIEKAIKRFPKSHRHRIEHCSVCPPYLTERISRIGIRVVSQPGFIYYNGDRYLETVEHRQINYLYPFGTLLKSGIHVAGSSDSPVAPANPIMAIYSAVTRNSANGKIINSNERITPIDALRMFTTFGAEACFSENSTGSITAGKSADLAVLSGNPLSILPDKIKDIKTEMTIIGGKIVWNKL